MNNYKQMLVRIGASIRDLRIKKKITQDGLARLSDMEKSSLSRIETGKVNVTVLTLERISKALKVTLSYLITKD